MLEEKTTREATVYQAGWSAYHDVPGMIELNGGKKLFVAKLTDFFERTPDFSTWSPYSGTKNPYHQKGQEPWWNPYNNPVNEPTELIPFLFNRAGALWLIESDGKFIAFCLRVRSTLGPGRLSVQVTEERCEDNFWLPFVGTKPTGFSSAFQTRMPLAA